MFYRKKFWCFDAERMEEEYNPPQIEIQGDYNSNKARHLKIMFEKCDPELNPEGFCKTESEINTWLKRKFIIIL